MLSGQRMADLLRNVYNSTLTEDDFKSYYVKLMKDKKPICRAKCLDPPGDVPHSWNLHDIVPQSKMPSLHELPHCFLSPAGECSRDKMEWVRFLNYLQSNDMVAVAKFKHCEFYLRPPHGASDFDLVRVAYRITRQNVSDSQRHHESDMDKMMYTREKCQLVQPSMFSEKACTRMQSVNNLTARKHECAQPRDSASSEINRFPDSKFSQSVDHRAWKLILETSSRLPVDFVKQDRQIERNYARADPSYLETLGQAHSGWIFGAIAELVDNSRDAKATKLDISIEVIYLKRAGKNVPMLSIIDDGHGMTHQEIVRMTNFGHKQPNANDVDHIGRFGVGFKTGAMRLGRDAFVLTQTADSRSVAFLSQTLNEGKDNLEIPIVSYCRRGQFMEIDKIVQSEALAKHNLKAIKEFSPFDKYLIGEKAGLFHEKITGTQIYIWNLDEWGSDYCLEWHTGLSGGSSFHQGDILIRSRRIRSRPGQISQKVPLDYSLRSYLGAIYLVPRMRIYVQGSLVKSQPVANSLNNTCVETGTIMGKPIHLTLGRSQLEWEHANCGIFLYWHGRLIEAYKRVGGMVHNGDMGRGVIGVIDVTDLMNDQNGRVFVHNNKQGFQDCEQYALLEEWLGNKADEYWDKNYDGLQLKKDSALCKPDHEWVQCDRCRKWRMLNSGFDVKNLPVNWFCYMEPFNGSCEISEQKLEHGLITVSVKRSGYKNLEKPVKLENVADTTTTRLEGNNNDRIHQSVKSKEQGLKRIRRGLPRACKG